MFYLTIINIQDIQNKNYIKKEKSPHENKKIKTKEG